MSRAQLKRMYLDVNFFSNPKIEALGYKFGSASQACLLEILCAMSKATNAQVDEDFIYSRIHKHRIEQASDLFNYLLEKKILFKDGNGFSNGPVIKDQESYSRKLEASNARVTRFRGKKEALPSERETRTPDIDSDYDNVIDLNILKEDPKAVKAIARWIEHRRKINKPLDQMAVDSLIMLYGGRYDELPDDIDHSISNGWKTLNAKPKQQPSKVFKPPEPAVRRTINNYVPPTQEERKRLTPEQVAANRKLIEEKLGKVKGVS